MRWPVRCARRAISAPATRPTARSSRRAARGGRAVPASRWCAWCRSAWAASRWCPRIGSRSSFRSASTGSRHRVSTSWSASRGKSRSATRHSSVSARSRPPTCRPSMVCRPFSRSRWQDSPPRCSASWSACRLRASRGSISRSRRSPRNSCSRTSFRARPGSPAARPAPAHLRSRSRASSSPATADTSTSSPYRPDRNQRQGEGGQSQAGAVQLLRRRVVL